LTPAKSTVIPLTVHEDISDNPLQAEFLSEKASAYFSRVRKMQEALAALAQYDQSPLRATGPQSVAAREELLAEAAEQVFFFLIQREALRLPYYQELFADFDIPEELRNRLGPKRFGKV
jgi:hypothetical protein